MCVYACMYVCRYVCACTRACMRACVWLKPKKWVYLVQALMLSALSVLLVYYVSAVYMFTCIYIYIIITHSFDATGMNKLLISTL